MDSCVLGPRLTNSTPAKRFATERDVANQVAIIASNKISPVVTGEIIMVGPV